MAKFRMVDYEDGHQSGRFDAQPRPRLAMNHQIAQTCGVALITEYLGLNFMINGWGDHGAEARIVFDQDLWHAEQVGSVHLKTSPWKRGTDQREGLDIPWALLRSKKFKLTLLRAGGHLPAHLDDHPQEVANTQALHGLGPAFRPVLGDLHPDQVSMSFDFNRQLTLAKNADLINGAVKPLGLHLLVPPGMTHRPNHRIDGFVVSRGSDKQEMLDWVDQYDHRGVRRQRRVRVSA